jgi:hypothetical protein
MRRFLIVLLVLGAPAGTLAAQEKPAGTQPQQAAPGASLVPVRLQLVLSRFQGEKRVSSMPYTLQLTANEREMTILRMGTEVPVATGGGGYNYRSVGTNIDCRITQVVGSDGQYKVQVTITDSSVRFPEKQESAGAPGSSSSTAPAFRSFTANFYIVLRDGQTAQYTSASDPASGEVLKVDATLTILK